jgi:lipid A disaccharide synthetase
VQELESLLQDSKKQRRILDDLDQLKHKLGNEGASEKAAEVIVNMVK